MSTINYVIKHVRPLDIILFRGSSYFSQIIAYCSRKMLDSPPNDTFSHIGIVITREIVDDPKLEPGVLYILESTLSGTDKSKVNSIHHPKKKVFGVQVRPLIDVLNEYLSYPNTSAAYAYLNMRVKMDEGFKKTFTEIYYRVLDRIYDPNPCSLCGALFPCLREARDITQELTHTENLIFCSELVAIILKYCNILSNKTNTSNVVPEDFIGYDRDSEIPTDLYIDLHHIYRP